jgi:hypothetical protein
MSQPSLVEPVAGWGGRDRTSEWRNQNPLDFLTISKARLEKVTERRFSNINSLATVSK